MKTTLGLRYNQEALAGKNFDAIIIGSGISGLATAALMAKNGKKVVVLERHYMAGGFTHYFRRKNFEWDVGLHYIGDVGNDRSMGKKLFDYVTDGKVQWHKMGDPYDQAIFPDKTYDFISGRQNFIDKMTTYFPEERKSIEAYLDLIKRALKTSEGFFAMKALPPVVSYPLSFYFNPRFYRYSDQTVLEALSKITKNQKLISVLTTQWGDYGLPPHQASFIIHAMVANHYIHGGYFPVGGSKVIASSAIETIRKNGSEVYVRAPVSKLILKRGCCYGVKMENGDEIYAKSVISSAGVFNTFSKFIEDTESSFYEKKLLTPLSHLERSVGHVSLYLGLNKTAKDLKLTAGNQWIFPSYNHKKNVEDFLSGKTKNFPVVYVSFPSAKDPLWEQEHGETSTIDVISLMPFERVEQWEDTKWFKRGDSYLQMKEEMIESFINTVEKHNPGVRQHIVMKELSTPLSTRHFTGYEKGEIYGLSHDPKRFRQKVLRPHTPIKNLYLTGQDTVSAGVMGGLSSGMITSIAILKKNLQKEILNS